MVSQMRTQGNCPADPRLHPPLKPGHLVDAGRRGALSPWPRPARWGGCAPARPHAGPPARHRDGGREKFCAEYCPFVARYVMTGATDALWTRVRCAPSGHDREAVGHSMEALRHGGTAGGNTQTTERSLETRDREMVDFDWGERSPISSPLSYQRVRCGVRRDRPRPHRVH